MKLRYILTVIVVTLIVTNSKKSSAQNINFLPKEIRQLEYVTPYPPIGINPPRLSTFELRFTYDNSDTIPYFLNGWIINPNNNNEKWAIENLMSPPFPGPRDLAYQMPLHDIFPQGQQHPNVGGQFLVTDTIMINPPFPGPPAYQPYNVLPEQIIFGPNGAEWDVLVVIPIDTLLAPMNIFIPIDTPRDLTRGCRVPNINLDSTKHGVDATYAGDWNACAPAGCANSMEWLEKVFPNEINTGLSHRDKLKELSKLMQRQAGRGVSKDKIVEGKLAFIDKYKLPIRVKFQHQFIRDTCINAPDTTYKHKAKNMNRDLANPGKYQMSWDWIWAEMEHGEDVEMWIAKKDIVGDSLYAGHIVTLTGISEEKGVRRITYKDDRRQQDSTGLQELPFTIDSTSKGYWFLKEADIVHAGRLRSRSYIAGFYSESYDSTITFVSVPERFKQNDFEIKVYNNPFDSKNGVVLEFNANANEDLSIHITDMQGRQVHSYGGKALKNNKYKWEGKSNNGLDLPKGIYLIKIVVGDRVGVVRVTKY